jgi:hypothetical protein
MQSWNPADALGKQTLAPVQPPPEAGTVHVRPSLGGGAFFFTLGEQAGATGGVTLPETPTEIGVVSGVQTPPVSASTSSVAGVPFAHVASPTATVCWPAHPPPHEQLHDPPVVVSPLTMSVAGPKSAGHGFARVDA